MAIEGLHLAQANVGRALGGAFSFHEQFGPDGAPLPRQAVTPDHACPVACHLSS